MEFMNSKLNQEEREPEEEPQAPVGPIWDTKEYLDVIKHYSEDELIPEKVRSSKWGIFGKALSQTFLDKDDLPMIDIWANILRIDSLINQPPHKITFDEVHSLDQSQFYMFCTARRAIGTERDKMNERTLQVTQIGQTISTQTGGAKRPSGGGMLSRLRRLF